MDEPYHQKQQLPCSLHSQSRPLPNGFSFDGLYLFRCCPRKHQPKLRQWVPALCGLGMGHLDSQWWTVSVNFQSLCSHWLIPQVCPSLERQKHCLLHSLHLLARQQNSERERERSREREFISYSTIEFCFHLSSIYIVVVILWLAYSCRLFSPVHLEIHTLECRRPHLYWCHESLLKQFQVCAVGEKNYRYI